MKIRKRLDISDAGDMCHFIAMFVTQVSQFVVKEFSVFFTLKCQINSGGVLMDMGVGKISEN